MFEEQGVCLHRVHHQASAHTGMASFDLRDLALCDAQGVQELGLRFWGAQATRAVIVVAYECS
jgi:hypothetical protein